MRNQFPNNKDTRRLYRDLAWTFPIISPPEDYVEETETYHKWIQQYTRVPVKTLLHLGCGAGHNDFSLKKYYRITGIDLSPSMLKMAKRLNSEVAYQQGDMRSVRLKSQFDAVACFDSIDYMISEDELQLTIITAWEHLKPGGVFLVLAECIKENFVQNKVYCTTHQKDNIEIIFIENNYDPDPEDSVYEEIMIYMIRKDGKLTIETDTHLCGLYSERTWQKLIKKTGFGCVQKELKLAAHPDTVYPVFIGIKPLNHDLCIGMAS